MGQYYVIANISKREMLVPWDANDGAKLLEWGLSTFGVRLMWTLLCADGNDRGGGDFHPDKKTPHKELIGSWVGDIVIATGDYADPFIGSSYFDKVSWDTAPKPDENLYDYAGKHFTNITPLMLELIDGSHLGREKEHQVRQYFFEMARQSLLSELWQKFTDLHAAVKTPHLDDTLEINEFIAKLSKPFEVEGFAFEFSELIRYATLPM